MKKSPEPFLSWVEIDCAALRHNFKVLKKNAVEILPVIKADAYGHGMIAVADVLDRLGAKIFGVSDVVEGMELRRYGFKNDILLLESPLPAFVADIVTCGLTPSVCTLELARALNKEAGDRGQKVKVHIKVDTGMGRLGVWHLEAAEFIRLVSGFPNLIVEGVFTHFPLADSDSNYTRQQLKHLTNLTEALGDLKQCVRYIHAANSVGLLAIPHKLRGGLGGILNMARPGLMLYGLYPREELRKKIKLKPVMSVKTHVLYVKILQKGRGVSYGHTYVAKKDRKVATLAIGYSDGYFRSLSNKAYVLIADQRCPVLGNVTMDQIMVDVTAVKKVKAGDIAVVLGADKKNKISAEELGVFAGTINYEIVCNLGNRLEREYHS
ncbi:MAG: alanine racemase [Candidatus Omnitrophica bacterium]|nr:alanine racemase [Candidatus Omnitrophota bacterium]